MPSSLRNTRLIAKGFLLLLALTLLTTFTSLAIQRPTQVAHAAHEIVCVQIVPGVVFDDHGDATVRAGGCLFGEVQVVEDEEIIHGESFVVCRIEPSFPASTTHEYYVLRDGTGCGSFGFDELAGQVVSIIGGEVVPEFDFDGEDIEEPADSCEGNLPGMGWILCLVVEYLVVFLEDTLAGTLIPSILNYNLIADEANQAGLLSVWSGFRILANIGFVIAFMVVIYAAASGNALSAYDVKRLLPRLLIGSIMVQLSFFICRELVELFNALGSGVTDLMLAPLSDGPDGRPNVVPEEFSRDGEYDLLLFAEELATVLTVILLIIGVLLAMAGILTVSIVFILRNIILTILIVISPIAFVAWVLPNTENLFKRWFKFFINNLALFPVAMAFFASGRLMASIWVSGTGSDAGGDISDFGNLWMALIILFLPWVFASQIVKLTNRLLGGAAEMVQNSLQQAREGGGKARKAVVSERFAAKAKAGDFGKVVSYATNPTSMAPGKGARRRSQARARQAAEAIESEDAKAAGINLQTKRARTRSKAHKKTYRAARSAGKNRADSLDLAIEAADNAEVKMLTGIVENDKSSPESTRAASSVLLDAHSDQAAAVQAVSNRVNRLQSTGNPKDARLADRIISDNVGAAGGIPQLYKDNTRQTVEGMDAHQLHDLKEGSLNYFTGLGDSNGLAARHGSAEAVQTAKYISERYLNDLGLQGTVGLVKQSNAQKVYNALQAHDLVNGTTDADDFRRGVDSIQARGDIPWTVS